MYFSLVSCSSFAFLVTKNIFICCSNNKPGSWQRGQDSQRSSPSPSRPYRTQEVATPHTAPVSVSILIPPPGRGIFLSSSRNNNGPALSMFDRLHYNNTLFLD